MKHFYFFIIAYVLINVVSCNAMNEQRVTQPKILAEIIAIQNPRQGTFLNNKDIVLHGTNGCSIFDINTNSEIIISSVQNSYLAVHPQGKKLALSSTNGNEVTLYNAETGAEEASIQNYNICIIRSTFNPLEETIFLWSLFQTSLIQYNYQTKCIDRCMRLVNQIKAIAFHPTQRQLMCGRLNGASIYNYEDGNFIYAKEIGRKTIFCEYSPDGSLIAGCNENTVYTIPSAFSVSDEIKFLPGDVEYLYMNFHPNSSVLATLSAPGDIVRYWDVKKNMPIDATQSVLCHYQDYCADINHCQYSHPYLSFSPDGKMLAITLKHKCIVIPVPFEVMYHSITSEKALFIYWLLKHDKDNQYNCFPDEIRQLLMDTLLEACKR